MVSTPTSSNTSPEGSSTGLRSMVLGLSIGLTVPAVAFGNAALGGVFAIALITAMIGLTKGPGRQLLRQVMMNRVGVACAAVFLWFSISSLFSSDPGRSFETVARVAALCFGFCVIIQALTQDERAQFWAERALAFGFAIVGILAVIGFGLIEPLLHIFQPLSDKPLAPQNLLKSFQSVVVISAPVLIWIAIRHGGWTATATAIACGTGLALVLGLSGQASRAATAGILGAALAPIVLPLLWRLRRPPRAVLIGLALCVGSIGAVSVLNALPSPPVTEEDRASGGIPVLDFHREAIWGFVYEKIQERPLLGHGINTIDRVPGAKNEVLDLNQEYVPSHPHNWMLEVASESGLPGLILVLSAIGIGVARLARKALSIPKGAALTALATTGAFWVSALANFSIWAAWWQVVFLCVLAIPVATLIQREAR